jgi:hypothetical protein
VNRDEYAEMLATVPATRNQVGRAHAEMKRLGIANRAERLDLAASLLGLGELDSFNSLTRGSAGRLVAILQNAPDAASIRKAAEDARRRDRPRRGLADVLGLLTAAATAVFSNPEGSAP